MAAPAPMLGLTLALTLTLTPTLTLTLTLTRSAMHGTSLSHLLRCAAGAGPCLLLVRDAERRVYGAYCTELREPRSGGQGDPSPNP